MEKSEIKESYKSRRKALRCRYKSDAQSLRREYENSLLEYYRLKGVSGPCDPPKRPLLEEIGNSVTHGVGALLAFAAAALMYIGAEGVGEYVGATVYFIGMLIMFLSSTLYHAFRHGTAVKRVFRRFDYSSIYLVIGATFAPILISYVGGVYGYAFLTVQWCVIVFGVVIASVFGPHRFGALHLALYLIIGWSGLLLFPLMYERGDFLFLSLILGGGVVYSLGVIPFAIQKGPSHFIWHFFVLLGAIVQWLGIYLQIYTV